MGRVNLTLSSDCPRQPEGVRGCDLLPLSGSALHQQVIGSSPVASPWHPYSVHRRQAISDSFGEFSGPTWLKLQSKTGSRSISRLCVESLGVGCPRGAHEIQVSVKSRQVSFYGEADRLPSVMKTVCIEVIPQFSGATQLSWPDDYQGRRRWAIRSGLNFLLGRRTRRLRAGVIAIHRRDRQSDEKQSGPKGLRHPLRVGERCKRGPLHRVIGDPGW